MNVIIPLIFAATTLMIPTSSGSENKISTYLSNKYGSDFKVTKDKEETSKLSGYKMYSYKVNKNKNYSESTFKVIISDDGNTIADNYQANKYDWQLNSKITKEEELTSGFNTVFTEAFFTSETYSNATDYLQGIKNVKSDDISYKLLPDDRKALLLIKTSAFSYDATSLDTTTCNEIEHKVYKNLQVDKYEHYFSFKNNVTKKLYIEKGEVISIQ